MKEPCSANLTFGAHNQQNSTKLPKIAWPSPFNVFIILYWTKNGGNYRKLRLSNNLNSLSFQMLCGLKEKSVAKQQIASTIYTLQCKHACCNKNLWIMAWSVVCFNIHSQKVTVGKNTITLFTVRIIFLFVSQCIPTWMRRNFGLRQQKKMPYMLDYTMVQMKKVNREKGYSI